MNKPLLFLIFNRPDLTAKVLEKIRAAKPPRIYIACDGARKTNPKDKELIKQTRQLVLDGIDWKCDIKTLFRDENLGCKDAVASAVSWFFQNEQDGIILEDDCVPAMSFFTFCQEMLDYYKDNKKVFTIHGTCLVKDINNGASYCFTKIFHPTGWATWADRWKYYTHDLSSIKPQDLLKISENKNVQHYWINKLKQHQQPNCTIWSPGWNYNIIKNGGYNITPTKNLICNIGFSDEMIRQGGRTAYMANMPTYEIDKIIHPANVEYDKYAVDYLWKNHFQIDIGQDKKEITKKIDNNALSLSIYKLASAFIENKTVLDFQSRTGQGTNLLCELGSPNQIFAIDNSIDDIAIAQQKYTSEKLKFIHTNPHKTIFDDSTFDTAILTSNLEQQIDFQKSIIEIKRILRPQGLLILSIDLTNKSPKDLAQMKKLISDNFIINALYTQSDDNIIKKIDSTEINTDHRFIIFAQNIKKQSNQLKYNPYGLNLDITVLCNNSCSFCWRSSNTEYLQLVTKENIKSPGIDLQLYKKIIDDAVQYKSIWWLGLCGAMGEPMMHPDFCSLSEYAASKKHFKAIITNTNGYAVDKHDLNRLLNSLTDLRFSVDSIDPQTYGKIHGDANKLQKVIDNIKMVIDFKKQHKCSATISVRFTENEHNKGQYPQFKEFFDNLGADRTIYGRTHAFAGVLKDSINKIGAAFCNQMFRIINFNFKCELTTCCINWKLEPTFGSIEDHTLKELWEGQQMEQFRKDRLNYQICQDCSGVGVIARQIDGVVETKHNIGYQIAKQFPECTVDIAEKMHIDMN